MKYRSRSEIVGLLLDPANDLGPAILIAYMSLNWLRNIGSSFD
jgi:hypothetical protein